MGRDNNGIRLLAARRSASQPGFATQVNDRSRDRAFEVSGKYRSKGLSFLGAWSRHGALI
jgi:hypothetical protein